MASATEQPPKPKNDDLEAVADGARKRGNILFLGQFYRSPFWLIFFIILWIYVASAIASDPDYSKAWNYLRGQYVSWMIESVGCVTRAYCPADYESTPPTLDGIALTLVLALTAYVIAMVIGLGIGIIRANLPAPPNTKSTAGRWVRTILYTILYNAVTFYVEFMRGIPSLVFVLLAGFAILPSLRDSINNGLLPWLQATFGIVLAKWDVRAIDPTTGITALALIYGAYLSEIFRAGIQGIPKGQVEAARSLGMTYFQTMNLIVVPQAIRAILPPLGNDFIAIIKDTALLTILGVNEITQLSRKWVGTSFKYPQTFLVLSMIYLTITIIGSLLVQVMERRLRRHER